MADILITTDMEQYNSNVKNHSKYLTEYNAVLAAYVAMGIGTPTGAEFKSLVLDPAGFVFDKITGGQDVVIGGLNVNKTKAMEILEKPAGYQALADLVASYKNTKQSFIHYLNLLAIVSGQVVIAQSVLDAELAAAAIYAKTDDEKLALSIAQAVKTLWETSFSGIWMPDIAAMIKRVVSIQVSPFNSSSRTDQSVKIEAKHIRGFTLGSVVN